MVTVGAQSSPSGGRLWKGNAFVKGSSESMRMALLTLSLVGVQFTWGIEMAYCTPYLLKLGLTKSHVSLVWIAGPLSGLIMQPLVGIVADRSHSRFGRRRPYMVIGTVIASLSLMVLGWTPEIVEMFISDRKKAEPWTLLLAVLGIYGIDFSINAVQASARSLIVDTLPSSKQQVGSAWATRMVATGCVLGYAAGSIDLTRVFGSRLGDTQFQQLIVVAVTFLCLAVSITCWAVEERVLVSTDDIDSDFKIKNVVVSIARKALSLPSRVSTVCWIQFWFWVGWFPFLFYSTTWIGEVYMRFNASAEAKEHPDSLAQIGRVGSTSLVIFAVVTLVSSIIFPIVVVGTPDETNSDFTPRPLPAIANVLHQVYKHRPSLLSTWTCSHIIFAGAMICTPFVTSLRAATILVAVCGVPGAVHGWATFAFLGAEINRVSRHGDKKHPLKAKAEHNAADVEALSKGSEESGVYLGILNLYTTAPQFIGTFISWVVFSVLEPGKSPELARHAHPDEHHGTDGVNAISVCLFIGGIAAVFAAYETRKLKASS